VWGGEEVDQGKAPFRVRPDGEQTTRINTDSTAKDRVVVRLSHNCHLPWPGLGRREALASGHER